MTIVMKRIVKKNVLLGLFKKKASVYQYKNQNKKMKWELGPLFYGPLDYGAYPMHPRPYLTFVGHVTIRQQTFFF